MFAYNVFRGTLKQLSQKYQRTPEAVFFMFVQALGITPLTGSTSETHMKLDLDTCSATMDSADVEAVRALLH